MRAVHKEVDRARLAHPQHRRLVGRGHIIGLPRVQDTLEQDRAIRPVHAHPGRAHRDDLHTGTIIGHHLR